ncbi:hypothetical protein [Mucilaginibacter antarcticus]|uniref:Uncharacterized protein n=1 Tax=Mucilaginibacter antarcticus TaxID=1855725 RepID=A0ABW5XLX0_9SPHI
MRRHDKIASAAAQSTTDYDARFRKLMAHSYAGVIFLDKDLGVIYRNVPVIVAQINCGPSTKNYTIYHIGDARLLDKLNPSRHINLFILHVQNDIDVFKSVARVKPDVTIYDHVMELGHAVNKWRWSYQFTYNKIKDLDPAKSWVLTWGERVMVGK